MNERYIRQIMIPEIGEAGQEKLKNAKVLIVGIGGLGSPISLYLTAAGVGQIGLIDDDIVSKSNLQRQILYTEAEIGQSKVECACRRLSALNSSTRFETYPNRFTPDNAATRYLIDDVCSRFKKPYVYGSISEFRGQVSVFNYRGGSRYSDLYPRPEVIPPARPGGVIGTIPGIIGCMEAAEVIKIITGYGEVLSGKLFLLDTQTLQHEIIEI